MSDEPVSRETPAPPAPPVAQGVFGATLPVAERYAELLATDGVVRGLIGPREAPRLWDRHLVNCALLARVVPQDATVCDVGSGAGLPGLVLAIVRPDLAITLCEPLLRRTTFLEEAVSSLGLSQVRVVRGRADSLHGSERFDVVTSRAVAPLPRLLDWSMPLVKPTGVLLALKGSSVAEEVDQASDELARWGCGTAEVVVLDAAGLDSPTYALRVPWAEPASVSWPPDTSSVAVPGGRGRTAGKRIRRPGR